MPSGFFGKPPNSSIKLSVGLTSAERAAGAHVFVPWTTGFGVGVRVLYASGRADAHDREAAEFRRLRLPGAREQQAQVRVFRHHSQALGRE